jgi:uncharacterized protein Yka (UPF0111/DUF47 family)
MAVHMLSTMDNPYNPFTHFDEWFEFDERAGYHTTQYLARLTRSSPDLSDADQSVAIENAIDEIVRENINGMYKKVPAPADWEEYESIAS